jgi:hypothetical protein
VVDQKKTYKHKESDGNVGSELRNTLVTIQTHGTFALSATSAAGTASAAAAATGAEPDDAATEASAEATAGAELDAAAMEASAGAAAGAEPDAAEMEASAGAAALAEPAGFLRTTSLAKRSFTDTFAVAFFAAFLFFHWLAGISGRVSSGLCEPRTDAAPDGILGVGIDMTLLSMISAKASSISSSKTSTGESTAELSDIMSVSSTGCGVTCAGGSVLADDVVLHSLAAAASIRSNGLMITQVPFYMAAAPLPPKRTR